MNFTAKQIGVELGITPQAVRQQLRDVKPATEGVKAKGQETSMWGVPDFPPALLERLDQVAQRQRCKGITAVQRVEILLSMVGKKWEPELFWDDVCADQQKAALKLQEALRPFLIQQHDQKLSPGEFKAAGMADYKRVFGNAITERYWDELFLRTIKRAGADPDWNNPEIYLPDQLRKKPAPAADVVTEALDFDGIETFLKQCRNRFKLTEADKVALWALTLKSYAALVRNTDISEKAAARRVRDFLWERLPSLAASRDALRKAFDLKLDKWQRDNPNSLEDGRAGNGDKAEYPSKDIRRVRHSAAVKNGCRIDSAWREEYRHLSEYTRKRHARGRRCPRAFYELVNRVRVDALYARVRGKRTLRKLIGSVTRNADGIFAMARWAVDDWTSNVTVLLVHPDGTFSEIQPQIITVMDFASRKWVGWSMSTDKGPTSRLVCAAVLDGFRRHGVCRQLWVENGSVFGKALNINGKEDEEGRTVVAGLGKYGCDIHHFDKMSPTSKGELEKSFDLVQRKMERHPGYAGRLQMLDASEDFKREQRLIRSGKLSLEAAKKFRYTYDEFTRVMLKLINEYNNTEQYGHLGGLTPNEAFEALQDPTDPPIKFNNELLWYLNNEHYLVTVQAGGVSFTHYGRPIQIRSGGLQGRNGEKLWAMVGREDASVVTFMDQDHGEMFTVATCLEPSANESRIVTGGSLAAELQKIREHERAVSDELRDLKREFGDPRKELLAEIRGEMQAPAGERQIIIDPQLEDTGARMSKQRTAISEQRKSIALQQRRSEKVAAKTGLRFPASGLAKLTPEQLKKLERNTNGEEHL